MENLIVKTFFDLSLYNNFPLSSEEWYDYAKAQGYPNLCEAFEMVAIALGGAFYKAKDESLTVFTFKANTGLMMKTYRPGKWEFVFGPMEKE